MSFWDDVTAPVGQVDQFDILGTTTAATFEAYCKQYPLEPGMQVAAEINQGHRTVMEYLLSPVSKAVHEAGRAR